MAIDPFGFLSTIVTNRANKKLAEYQYSKDLEMWNRNNAYNAPQAQMNRLQQAGLNPNLVYGTGAVGNTSSQIPRYQAPNLQAPQMNMDVGSTIGMFQDIKMKTAQTKLVESQAKSIDQKTANDALMNILLGYKKEKEEPRRQYYNETAWAEWTDKFQKNALDAQKILTESERTKLLQQQRAQSEATVKMLEAKMKTEGQQQKLNEFKILLSDAGLNPNDPLWARALVVLIKKYLGIDINEYASETPGVK